MDSDQDSEQDQIQDFEADDEVPNLNIDSSTTNKLTFSNDINLNKILFHR